MGHRAGMLRGGEAEKRGNGEPGKRRGRELLKRGDGEAGKLSS
jgi:hypothetical protein